MAEGRRPQSGGAPRRDGRPGQSGGRPAGKDGETRGSGRPQGRGGKPAGKFGDKPGAGAARRGDWKGRANPDRRTDAERTADQVRYDGPEIPEHITGKELDRSVVAQLKSLPEKLAQRVARHLAAAQELIADDPTTAYQHTLAARARAQRLAVVREAVGEAAYAAGEFAEALAELRAAKRMNGAPDYLPIMADCERALKRPDRALTLIKAAPREKLSPELNAELTIVEAGARRDRGELDAALRTLENAHLMTKTRAPYVARLRYAYADALVEAGRLTDALTWFHRTEAVDADELTDAAERAAEIERQVGD